MLFPSFDNDPPIASSSSLAENPAFADNPFVIGNQKYHMSTEEREKYIMATDKNHKSSLAFYGFPTGFPTIRRLRSRQLALAPRLRHRLKLKCSNISSLGPTLPRWSSLWDLSDSTSSAPLYLWSDVFQVQQVDVLKIFVYWDRNNFC
jgi:hypothetical protein